jgi:hypothetical protein
MKLSKTKFHKNPSSGFQLLHADKWTDIGKAIGVSPATFFWERTNETNACCVLIIKKTYKSREE